MDHGTRPLTSGPEALRTIELLTAIYKSAFTRQIVARGSIVPGDPFYDALHGDQAPHRTKGQPPHRWQPLPRLNPFHKNSIALLARARPAPILLP